MSQTAAPKANPAPLGLVGFGMTTALLNLHNIGLFGLTIEIVALGLCLGGLAQIIAGLMEFKQNNTFGATAFTAYGLFWWSLIIIWVNPFGSPVQASVPESLTFYFILWGLFTLFLFVVTLRQSTMNKVVFFTLTVLFFLLAAASCTHIHALHTVAGVVGVICGLSAFYNGLAQVVNGSYGRTVFPV